MRDLIPQPPGTVHAALGSSVIGNTVTGYTKLIRYDIILTDWNGATMLGCRSNIVERYRDGSYAIVFLLKGGRFIAGYSLGHGMLFRGELVEDCSLEDARRFAIAESHSWMTADAAPE